MKNKAYILILMVSLVLTSCGLSKENKDNRKTLDGTWKLTNIDYQNNEGYFKSILFNDVSAKCFRGSEWFFRSNNSTGYYNILDGGECSPGQRNIRWSIQDDANGTPNRFQFKFIDEKKNDIMENQQTVENKKEESKKIIVSKVEEKKNEVKKDTALKADLEKKEKLKKEKK